MGPSSKIVQEQKVVRCFFFFNNQVLHYCYIFVKKLGKDAMTYKTLNSGCWPRHMQGDDT